MGFGEPAAGVMGLGGGSDGTVSCIETSSPTRTRIVGPFEGIVRAA